MDKSKNQHWVPRFYLRYFATTETRESSDPQVWIFSKHHGDPILTNIRNVASKRYLYSPKEISGSRDWKMEKRLSDVEALLAPIWPQLANGFLDLNDDLPLRKAVSLFVSTLHFRHPNSLGQVKLIHSQLVAIFEDFQKDEYGNPLIAEVAYGDKIKPFDNSNYIEFKNGGPEDFHRFFVDSISAHTGWLAKVLLEKRWSIIFSDHPAFITTDTPVAIINLDHHPFGISTPGTVLSFPISPTRILTMDDRHDQPKGQYYPLGQHSPGPFNLAAWHCCERFMISSRPTDLICAEMLKWADEFEGK